MIKWQHQLKRAKEIIEMNVESHIIDLGQRLYEELQNHLRSLIDDKAVIEKLFTTAGIDSDTQDLLIAILEEHGVKDLLNIGRTPVIPVLQKLSEFIANKRGLDLHAAKMGVCAWAIALNVGSVNDVGSLFNSPEQAKAAVELGRKMNEAIMMKWQKMISSPQKMAWTLAQRFSDDQEKLVLLAVHIRYLIERGGCPIPILLLKREMRRLQRSVGFSAASAALGVGAWGLALGSLKKSDLPDFIASS